MILTNSRYATSRVLLVRNAGGVFHPTVYRDQPSLPRKFLHYQVATGERLDTLAFRFFGDPTLWWLIADANPELLFPDELSTGSIIRIPQAS